MSKVICDVCGTTYPETASVCPICGSAKNTTAQTAAGSSPRDGASTGYVKGGRFSKRNVKKRNKGKIAERKPSKPEKSAKSGNQKGTNIGMVILIILLLIGIVVVMLYIGLHYFLPGAFKPKEDPSGSTPPASTTTAPPVARIPCEKIQLSSGTIELSSASEAWLLNVEISPKDTTDKVFFESSDENVVTVDQNGRITAVGGGEATVTVTCGDVAAICTVVCSFDPIQSTTTPPETTLPPVTVPDGFVLKLRYTEFTMSEKYPSPVLIFKETDGVKPTDITWSVDDPSIVAVNENGYVSAVGRGNTIVRATIAGQTASCKVIVSFDPAPADAPKYTISNTDVTLKVGETFFLTLTDERGVKMNVEWTANVDGFLTIDGSKITCKAAATSFITVSGVYDGVTYSCVVRFNIESTES